MRLGHLAHSEATLAKDRCRERLRAALAVRATNEDAAHLLVWVAQALEQGSRTAEAQPDSKSTARLESLEDLAVPRISVLVEEIQVFSSSS
jgi:hypothetical protein